MEEDTYIWDALNQEFISIADCQWKFEQMNRVQDTEVQDQISNIFGEEE